MAKKQTFGDKVKAGKKSGPQKVYVKVVRSLKTKDQQGVRFAEEMIGIPAEENVKSYLENQLTK